MYSWMPFEIIAICFSATLLCELLGYLLIHSTASFKGEQHWHYEVSGRLIWISI